MFMNILVGILFVVAMAAGVWGVVIDHRKDKPSTDKKETESTGK